MKFDSVNNNNNKENIHSEQIDYISAAFKRIFKKRTFESILIDTVLDQCSNVCMYACF